MKQMTQQKELKLPLTTDSSYLVIYWSVASLMLFSAIISILEIQRLNLLTIFFAGVALVMILFSKSASVLFAKEKVVFTYFFGIKSISFLMEDIHKIIVTDKKHIQLLDETASLLHAFYLSRKDGETFRAYLKQKKPSLLIEEKKDQFHL